MTGPDWQTSNQRKPSLDAITFTPPLPTVGLAWAVAIVVNWPTKTLLGLNPRSTFFSEWFLTILLLTAFLWSFFLVTAPFWMSLVPIVAAAYPMPPIATNSAIIEITSAGDD